MTPFLSWLTVSCRDHVFAINLGTSSEQIIPQQVGKSFHSYDWKSASVGLPYVMQCIWIIYISIYTTDSVLLTPDIVHIIFMAEQVIFQIEKQTLLFRKWHLGAFDLKIFQNPYQ